MGEIISSETVAEKKKRLRLARELREETREEEADEKYLQREILRNAGRMSASEIHLEYAKIILSKVLEEPGLNTFLFAQGTTDAGKEARDLVLFSVANMASDLTRSHKKTYP